MSEEMTAERIAYHIECGVGSPGHNHELLTRLYRENKRSISMVAPACERHETRPGSMMHMPSPLAVGSDDLPNMSAPHRQAEIKVYALERVVYPVAWFRCVVCDDLVVLTGKPQRRW